MKNILFSAVLLFPAVAFAQLTLPHIFTDHMVIQRDQPVPVWGNAAPGEKVSLAFDKQIQHVVADGQGHWKTNLDPEKAGTAYQLVITGEKGEKIKFNDIAVGDVWICAGQSNMNYSLHSDLNGVAEIAGSHNDQLREFRVEQPGGDTNPDNKYAWTWVPATGEQTGSFSAVAYYFAKQIQQTQKIPVGIVMITCGNSRSETWTDTSALNREPALKPLMDYWAKERNDKKAKINFIPGKFYNDMVLPVIPFAAKGVVWYQGESNALPDKVSGRTNNERTTEYKILLKTLINNWRSAWNKPQWPFYLVQLPNYSDPSGDIQWAKIRQAQLDMTQDLPHVAIAVTIDVGGNKNLHPRNKKPVGERVALLVLANEYNYKKGETSGPIIQKLTIHGDKAILDFTHTGKGLTFKEDTVKSFEIADKSAPNVFVTAEAVISGKQVIVSAAGVNDPFAVRYAWADNPSVSLFNKDGLPASPFLIKSER